MKKLILLLAILSCALLSCDKQESKTEPAKKQTQAEIPPSQLNNPADVLIASDEVYNIKRLSEPDTIPVSMLTKAMRDAAARLDLIDITGASYTVLGDGMTAKVLRFPDDASAYGFVAACRLKESSQIQFGSLAIAHDSTLMFSHGPSVVVLTTRTGDASAMSAQSLLAEKIDKRFGEEASAPPMFLLFPFSGRVAQTNQYYPRGYLGVDGLWRIYTTDYLVDNVPATFFFTLDDDGTQFLALENYAKQNGAVNVDPRKLGFSEGHAVQFKDAKLGTVVAGLVKGKLIGIAGKNLDGYQRLLTSWIQGLGG